MSGITIATSMWSETKGEVGAKRERELNELYWKDYTDRGCLTRRFNNTQESALDIVTGMLSGPGITVQLTKEIMEDGKSLSDTTAAQAVSGLRALGKKRPW